MSKRKWAAIAILAAHILEKEGVGEHRKDDKMKRKRSVWMKNWLKNPDTDGYCAKLMPEYRAEEPELYRNFVSMTADQFDRLLHLVRPYIQKNDTNMRLGISPEIRLILTLRYLATGENFTSLQYIFRIPQTTILRIIPEVLDAINKVLVQDFFKLPKTEEEWESVSQLFNKCWHFPNCIGAVDGKHVVMVAPANAGSVFYNYKGTHSIVLTGIADAEYKLLYIDVGRNGRHSDGGVFNRCTFGQALDTDQLRLPPLKALPCREMPVPYVLVADDAFALRKNIMKPYAQSGLTMVQRVFNFRLSHARRIIENVFGIMSARFRVLRKPIYLDAEKAKKVVLACYELHNYLITTNKTKYAPCNSFNKYDAEGNLVSPGEWRSEGQVADTLFLLENPRHCTDDAKEIQREFAAYFVDEGDVEWQYSHLLIVIERVDIGFKK